MEIANVRYFLHYNSKNVPSELTHFVKNFDLHIGLIFIESYLYCINEFALLSQQI